MKYLFLYFSLFLFALPVFAQNDTITVLEKVVLQSSTLEEFSNTQHVRVLSDSLLKNNPPLLTDVLKFHTPIYFKENGLGMVSSVSFRGTTASQTAVVWNGININSKFNGQTDFNAINISGFDKISVRSGGGSVLYGTGAIGGSVHLRNEFRFEKGVENELKLAYGSFNTFDGRYGLSFSNSKTNLQVNVARTSSDNDYPYPDSDRKNLNGQYYNTSAKVNFAYKIDQNNILKLYTSIFDDERHFSLIRPTENRTKYQNFHAWNLIVWESRFGRFSSDLKLAYLNEKFSYFPTIENNSHTNGTAETWIAKYNLGTDFDHGMEIHGLLDYSYTKGQGTNIPENYQKIGSVGVLMKQRVSNRFLYEIGAKKEFTENYESPFLFSAGTVFNATDFYSLKLNFSKNYRIPTFNDSYWQGSGNTDLKPETSHQAEIGNYVNWKNFDFSITAYFIDIQDMIRWLPAENGMWEPENTAKVQTYGLESNANYHKNIGKHHFSLHASYGYTISENEKTGKQLIYVPFHKATASFAYHFQRWGLTYNFLYNGEVFARTDNNPNYNIPAYQVSNVDVFYRFGKKIRLKIGGKIKNLFNEKYQSVENRFFPGRNYTLYLIFKF
ncbi:MAG TPA: TonB-dependent receptor [Flavobacteriaceae bacterium]|nr:TonB-dependent receptor [Flavobacteriaceae bacterium]